MVHSKHGSFVSRVLNSQLWIYVITIEPPLNFSIQPIGMILHGYLQGLARTVGPVCVYALYNI